jgi:hypothetical protein
VVSCLEAMASSPIHRPVPASQGQPKEDLDSKRRPSLPHELVTIESDGTSLSMLYADLAEYAPSGDQRHTSLSG